MIYKCLLLMLGGLILGCNKQIEHVDPYTGTIAGQKNGIEWNPKIFGVGANKSLNKFRLEIHHFNGPYRDESLSIHNIPKKKGSYSIYPRNGNIDTGRVNSIYMSFVDDGDAVCDVYLVDSTFTLYNVIQIDSFEVATNEVIGSFFLKAILKQPKCGVGSVDTLVFSNMQFHTKLVE